MIDIITLTENTFSITKKLFEISMNTASKLAGSKWPKGISSVLARKIIDEFMLFHSWVLIRQLENSQIERMIFFIVKSNLLKHCLSDNVRNFFNNRQVLYEQYCNDEIIAQIGYGDPLTSLFIFLILYLQTYDSHFSDSLIDGRDLISIMNRIDSDAQFIASSFIKVDKL